MFAKHAWKLSLAALALLPVYGCGGGKVDMAEMMKTPDRPAELNKLDMFVGRWQTDMEMPGPDGKMMKCASDDNWSWDADKRWMTGKFTFTMGDTCKCNGTMMMTYDPNKKCYRSWYFDSDGRIGEGTGKYDEGTKTWTMDWSGQSLYTKQATIGVGTMKFVDAGTLECSMKEWLGSWKMGKPFMEMNHRAYKK